MAYHEHLLSTRRYMKVAKLSGLVLGLHPHGDAAVNDATTAISRDWILNVPLIDIHGNNGAIDGSGAAAARYIEARLTPAAELILKDLDQNCIEMQPNFDDTMEEPTVLPASWPVIFINGTKGIAFGMATNILPHNPLEVLDGAIYLAGHPGDPKDQLPNIIKGPDFPTGGTIVGYDGIEQEFKNGRGSFTVRGTAHINEKERQIIITEIPFGVTTKALLKSFSKVLEPKRKALGITAIDDESSDKIRIVISFKKRAPKRQLETALNLLYQRSDLEVTLHADNHLIWERRPIQANVKQYLNHFLNFRSQVLLKILKHQQKTMSNRQEIVQGFLRLVDIADNVVPLAKASASRDDLEQTLQDKFNFTQPQAHAIAGRAIYRLGHQDTQALEKELKDLTAKLHSIHVVLSSRKNFLKFLIQDLRHTRKFFAKSGNYKRKTQIIAETHVKQPEIKQQDLIRDEDVIVVVKDTGTMQRMTNAMYENSKDSAINPETIVATLNTNTRNIVMGFTAHGLAYTRIANDLPSQGLKTEPDSLQYEIASYKANDRTLGAVSFPESQAKDYYLLSVTTHGHIKLTTLDKIMPKLTTKLYQKRTQKYNGLRIKGDTVAQVWCFTKDELHQHHYHLIANTNKKRTQERDVDIASLNIQGSTGSGSSLIKLDPDKGEKFTKLELQGQDETNPKAESQPEK